VFTTDGRIKALDLTVLKDDKNFFPVYNVAPVIRKPVLDDNPDLEKLFAPVAKKLTNKVLLDLNAQVDVDGRDPTDVAMDWLKKEGFLQ
jgi:osmoprotectant transport system substrate-binding protein